MVIEMLLLAWVWKDVVAGIELGVEKIKHHTNLRRS
jgi:hypothetical protein